MLSMTGFGSHRLESERGIINIQISAVNHRHCQVSVRNDFRDLTFDERIRKICRSALKRGSINVNVQWQPAATESLPLDQLKECYQQLSKLADEVSAPPPRLELMSSWLQRAAQSTESDDFPMIESCLQQALDGLQQMRREEGGQMNKAFNDLHVTLYGIHQRMGETESARADHYRERLLERVSSVLEDSQIEEKDIIREVAVFADRIDISEELVRLSSHLEQLATLFADDNEQQGKRLEFLLQECGREVNTIGSKAHDADLSLLVVDANSALEQMREQAANIL